jgi:hypothetical protein
MSRAEQTSSLPAKIMDVISVFCHERLHGKDDMRRAQVMDLLSAAPEGQALLQIAEEN